MGASFNQVSRTTEAYQKLLFFSEVKPAFKYRSPAHHPPIVPDENIVGICTQVKCVEKKPTGEPTVTFIVKKKRSRSRMVQRQEDLIPPELPIYDAEKKKFQYDIKVRTDIQDRHRGVW
jgi:hypothetical protein